MRGFAFPKIERDALVASEPEKFLMPKPSDLRYNWVVVRLEAIDEDEMSKIVTEAWRMVVPKRVAAERLGWNKPTLTGFLLARPNPGGDQVEQQERTAVREAISLSPTELAVPVTADDHIWGREDASVTLVEYGEFECPDCGRAFFQLKQLRDHLDSLDARFVFRHLARDEVHPFSVRAALAAEAAGLQGRFWEMHDHLFTHQHALEYEELDRHALEVGLDVERFGRDLSDPRLLEVVTAQGQGAVRSGVTSTPTLFINGRRYNGSHQLDALLEALDEENRRLGRQS